MIRESEIYLFVIRDPLFFQFVNRARDPPCTTLIKRHVQHHAIKEAFKTNEITQPEQTRTRVRAFQSVQ